MAAKSCVSLRDGFPRSNGLADCVALELAARVAIGCTAGARRLATSITQAARVSRRLAQRAFNRRSFNSATLTPTSTPERALPGGTAVRRVRLEITTGDHPTLTKLRLALWAASICATDEGPPDDTHGLARRRFRSLILSPFDGDRRRPEGTTRVDAIPRIGILGEVGVSHTSSGDKFD